MVTNGSEVVAVAWLLFSFSVVWTLWHVLSDIAKTDEYHADGRKDIQFFPDEVGSYPEAERSQWFEERSTVPRGQNE
jgi:hypothetical protein